MHVRLSLLDSEPPVTRDIAIDSGTTLDLVHLVVQRHFGWENVHLHRFDAADPYERWHADAPVPRSWLPVNLLDEFDGEPDTDTTLAEALGAGGGTLWYEYDFGDSWRLTITAIDEHADITAPNSGVQTLLATTRALPLLRPLLTRVTTEVGSEWCERIAAAVQHPPIIDDGAIAASIRPIEWMLRRIGPDGTALTAAGWLPPAIVRDAMRELDWEHRDVGMMNREDRTFAIADLRVLMRQLGLVRVAKGRIAPTAVARRLLDDSAALWQHVAAQLIARQPREVDRDLMLMLALHLVSGEALDRRPLARRIARDLTALGWRDRGEGGVGDLIDGRVSAATVEDFLFSALQPLRDLGAFAEGSRRREWGSAPTEVGRALGWALLGGEIAHGADRPA